MTYNPTNDSALQDVFERAVDGQQHGGPANFKSLRYRGRAAVVFGDSQPLQFQELQQSAATSMARFGIIRTPTTMPKQKRIWSGWDGRSIPVANCRKVAVRVPMSIWITSKRRAVRIWSIWTAATSRLGCDFHFRASSPLSRRRGAVVDGILKEYIAYETFWIVDSKFHMPRADGRADGRQCSCTKPRDRHALDLGSADLAGWASRQAIPIRIIGYSSRKFGYGCGGVVFHV